MSFQKNLVAVVKALIIASGLTLLILFIVFGSVILMFLNYSFSEYDYYSEICIDKNKEIKEYVSSGFGVAAYPFIIDNLEFSGFREIGLRINSISKFIIIRNIEFKAEISGLSLGYLEPGLITIENCTFTNCDMDLYRSDSVTIRNNKFHENNLGIRISNSENLVIESNTFDSGGICFLDYYYVQDLSSLTINDNYVQGREILYLRGESNLLLPSEYSQVFLYKCNNITIENQEFFFVSHAFVIVDSENCTIRNSRIQNCYSSCEIYNSKGITIETTIFEDFLYYENHFYYYDLSGAAINVQYTSNFSLRNSSVFNSISAAVYIYSSNYSIIEFNNISQSSQGLHMSGATYCIVQYNQFYNNSNYGVCLRNSMHNFIHHNNFIDNTNIDYPQARDDRNENYWYSPSLNEGNFWSDLGNSTTYEIYTYSQQENNYDLHPLAKPINIFG